jgi:hypothetical protein
LSSDGAERDDSEPLQLEPTKAPLTGQFAPGGRPSAAGAAAAALQSDEAAQLQQQRFITQIEYFDSGLVQWRRIPEGERGKAVTTKAGRPYKFAKGEMMGRPKNGPFPTRLPFRPAYAPPPTDNDARCPQCTGSCKPQSEGDDPCAWRERIRADHKALERILQRRIAPVDDLRVQLGKLDPDYPINSVGRGVDKDKRFNDWADNYAKAHKADTRRRTGDIRRKRMLLDRFALDGQLPAPSDIAALEEILMELHRFFQASLSMSDWSAGDDASATPLSIAERMALFAKQAPDAPKGQVILHVAKTEGIDLKYLGRVASASAAAATGPGLVDTSKIRQALDLGLIPARHMDGEQHGEAFYKAVAVAALEELMELRRIAEAKVVDFERVIEALGCVEPGRTKTETLNRALALLDQRAMRKRA